MRTKSSVTPRQLQAYACDLSRCLQLGFKDPAFAGNQNESLFILSNMIQIPGKGQRSMLTGRVQIPGKGQRSILAEVMASWDGELLCLTMLLT